MATPSPASPCAPLRPLVAHVGDRQPSQPSGSDVGLLGPSCPSLWIQIVGIKGLKVVRFGQQAHCKAALCCLRFFPGTPEGEVMGAKRELTSHPRQEKTSRWRNFDSLTFFPRCGISNAVHRPAAALGGRHAPPRARQRRGGGAACVPVLSLVPRVPPRNVHQPRTAPDGRVRQLPALRRRVLAGRLGGGEHAARHTALLVVLATAAAPLHLLGAVRAGIRGWGHTVHQCSGDLKAGWALVDVPDAACAAVAAGPYWVECGLGRHRPRELRCRSC